jgi:hypothetical protein
MKQRLAPLLVILTRRLVLMPCHSNRQNKHCTLGYDATHCELDGIENIVKINGADISHDWWTNLKEGYYQFVDENIRDNAKHKPWRCHNSPQGNHSKHKKMRI